jgi:REP element-mobilizing transposase RayT
MSDTVFHQMYYHFVWSTKVREPQIKETSFAYVAELVSEDANRRGANVLACGVMHDHIHLLVNMPPTVFVPTFIGQVKGAVAHDLNKAAGERVVQWQEGYGVVTLREADIDKATHYVNNQPAIHAKRKKPSLLEITEQPR